METSKVLSALASSEEVRELAKRIRTGKAKELRADGLCGSSVALLLASIMNGRGNNPNMLVVMNDMDDAGYLYHDLTQMMGDERVLFFPSSYKRAIKYNQKDAGNEILRMQTLSLILSQTLPSPSLQGGSFYQNGLFFHWQRFCSLPVGRAGGGSFPTHLSSPKAFPPTLRGWGFVRVLSNSVRPCLCEFLEFLFQFLFRSHHDDADVALRESRVTLDFFVGLFFHQMHSENAAVPFG